ncbi:hypothetical protein [Stutzerimonas urumqiensis]|uniref:hypothetical protein n=1 Tax=Stutzerimonas urumqiensis TaxID=638269 RepID=UPI000EB35C6E|nr:hypothetical protein [Stutzerimonas urumqiensis]
MRIVPLALALLAPLALAGPAPYYKWQSKLDGQIACQQTSPGEGWELFEGTPYRDLRCTQPIARMIWRAPGASR